MCMAVLNIARCLFASHLVAGDKISVREQTELKLCSAGLAEYFRNSSEEEREHAEKLMIQQVRCCLKQPGCLPNGSASDV